MPYMGQSYRHVGDPGFFDVLKTIGKGALGFVTGGPAGAVRAVLPQPTTRQVMQAANMGGPGTVFVPPTGAGTALIPRPGFIGAAQRAVPGGATGFSAAGIPRGYHLSKDGSGRIVRNRRTNYANPRALNRSIRRVEGFSRLVQRSRKAVKKAARAID